MARTIGWENEDVKAGFGGPNKESQYRAEKGTRHVVRLVGMPQEYRTHKIDDVLEKNEKGEQKAFNVNCAKKWDEKAKSEDSDDLGAWVGECQACDQEYDVAMRYVCGMILLAEQKGKAPKATVLPPESSPRFWDFAATTYERIRTLVGELRQAEPPRKLHEVDVVITCEDSLYQKINLNVSQAKPLCSPAHVAAYKEVGTKLIAECSKESKNSDLQRRLKKKAKGHGGAEAGAEAAPTDEELNLDDLDAAVAAEETPPPAPKVTKKATTTKAPATKAPAATAKATPKVTPKVTPKATAKAPAEEEPAAEEEEAPAEEATDDTPTESTGDGDMESLLGELDGLEG